MQVQSMDVFGRAAGDAHATVPGMTLGISAIGLGKVMLQIWMG